MKKAFVVFDMPETCVECPCRYAAEQEPLGNYTYRQIFRCKICPLDLPPNLDAVLEDITHKKPSWCPLKELPTKMEVPNVEENYESHYVSLGYNSCVEKLEQGELEEM